jgi:hypothetical protein
LASQGLCSVLEFGKLTWSEILYFENKIKQTNPEMQKAEQEQAQYEKMLEIVQQAK